MDLVTGRLRWYHHLAIAALGAWAAWLWFGASGLLPLLLWAWYRQPRPGQTLHYRLDGVTGARLGAYRTVAMGPGWRRLEIYRDELPPAELAALRRHLKVQCSTRDRA